MTAPIAVVDTLNSLLEAELNSVFRFMGEGSPHLTRATAEVRRPLADMVVAEQRRAANLAAAIESLGGVPAPMASIRPEEQFLAYLSLKFLLPKLVDEKRLQIDRYENALTIVPASAHDVIALINAHLGELREELAVLEKASAQVIAAAKSARSQA